MADKRAYFKLDVGYLTNPKIASLLDESPLAVILHIGSIAYAAQHLTDGVVPIRLLLRLTGASVDDARSLFDLGMWDDVGGGNAEIHDYTEHQRSAEQVKRARDAGKLAAQTRWDADGNADRMPTALGDPSEGPNTEIGERERKKNSSSEIADAIPDPKTEPRPDIEKICEHMADSIASRGVKRPTIPQAWRTAARLMLDKDGYTLDQTLWMIDWTAKDSFWSSNILSVTKLREKMDQLVIKVKAEREKKSADPRQNTSSPAWGRGVPKDPYGLGEETS